MPVAEAAQNKPAKMDSAKFMEFGKATVVDNFNTHRRPERSAVITAEDIHVVWFTKAMGIWKMIVVSNLARGLMWEITYNSVRDDVYLDVYSKITNIKISVGRDPA